MTTNQKASKGVILLDTKLYWYQQGLANILTIDLPVGSIQYFEVLKKDDIYQAIKTAVEQSKIPPSIITLLLSSRMLFTQEFPKDPDLKKNKANLDTFLSVVPFEDVSYTSFSDTKSQRIIAANQELYQTIVDALISCGFTVEVVSPLTALGQQFSSVGALDAKTAQTALSVTETLRKNALTPVKRFESVEDDLTPEPIERKKKEFSRVYIMVGVFGVLLLILAYMVYTNLLAPAPVHHPAPAATSKSIIKPSPTQAITIASLPVDTSINAATLSAQIVYTNNAQEATAIQSELKALGIQKITITNGLQIAVPKTEVTVDTSVSPELKDKVVTDLEQAYESVSVQSNNLSQYDLIITTGTMKPNLTVTP